MIKYIFMCLLCIHIIGDFYVQREDMALKKEKQFKWTVYHAIIYAAIGIVLILLVLPDVPWIYILIFAVSHALIDMVKFGICKYAKKDDERMRSKRNVFLIDQGIHLLVLIFISYCMRNLDVGIICRKEIRQVFSEFGISEIFVLTWGVKILLIHKPANILIANILGTYKPSEDQSVDADKKAGRLIGTLERIIMTIFLSIGQYSAVGLVLTAKSIARYDKISKDQVFAEYYLLGTLLSSIVAIVVTAAF